MRHKFTSTAILFQLPYHLQALSFVILISKQSSREAPGVLIDNVDYERRILTDGGWRVRHMLLCLGWTSINIPLISSEGNPSQSRQKYTSIQGLPIGGESIPTRIWPELSPCPAIFFLKVNHSPAVSRRKWINLEVCVPHIQPPPAGSVRRRRQGERLPSSHVLLRTSSSTFMQSPLMASSHHERVSFYSRKNR